MVKNKELIDEYMFLAILFGYLIHLIIFSRYITMFSPVFPFAPVLIMLMIYFNLQFSIDSYQNSMRREGSEAADSIGM
jgi:hypothetical protein